MRRGQHIGKIVISSEIKSDVQLLVRLAIRKLQLQPSASYLIVDGLKNLCDSVAIHLARHEARHIIVMSRSGTNDKASARVIAHCVEYECEMIKTKGDANDLEFVRSVFKLISHTIVDVIQEAMILRVSFRIITALLEFC